MFSTCISNKFPVFATCRKNEIAVILCWHNLLWLNAYISCLCIFNQDLVTVKILCYQRVAYSSLNCELLKARPRLYIIHNVISKIVFVYIELLKVGSRNFWDRDIMLTRLSMFWRYIMLATLKYLVDNIDFLNEKNDILNSFLSCLNIALLVSE